MDSPVFLKDYSYLFLLTTALASGIAPEPLNFGTFDNIVIQHTLVNPPKREKQYLSENYFKGLEGVFRVFKTAIMGGTDSHKKGTMLRRMMPGEPITS